MHNEKLTLNVTEETFERDVLQSPRPALVDFWAPWCGPCRQVGPVVDELAGEYADVATVAKVDVDRNPQLAARYGVQSIPTLLFFENGKVVDRVVGAASRQVLADKLAARVRVT